MRKTTLLTVAIAVALIGTAPLAAADHFGTPTRDAAYIGASHVNHGLNEALWTETCETVFGAGECPTPIPSGIINTVCDDAELEEGLDIQGIGGVLFCAVPQGSTISVALHDDLNDSPVARVTCLHSQGDVNWHVAVAQAAPTAIVPLPSTCAQSSSDPAGTTTVGIFNSLPPDGTGSTTGWVSLNY